MAAVRMNGYRKGAAAEYRAMRLLEAAGYVVMRAAGSHGPFDLAAFGPHDVKVISVKAGGKYCSAVEREQLQLAVVPPNCSKEIWRFKDRVRDPLIERL